jgi:hypothetical protein
LNHRSRRALRELADGETATVSGKATGQIEGGLNIHQSTALMFVRKGYAELLDDDTIGITREGLVKIGRVTISRSERRRRKEAESLRAQATGEWVPVPAGYSALASQNDADARRTYAETAEELTGAKSELQRALEWLHLSKRWGAEEAELESDRKEVERWRERVERAQAEFDALNKKKRAA